MEKFDLYVITTSEALDGLTPNKPYQILVRFDTDLCGSGHCIVVNNDKQDIVGYDSAHFKK